MNTNLLKKILITVLISVDVISRSIYFLLKNINENFKKLKIDFFLFIVILFSLLIMAVTTPLSFRLDDFNWVYFAIQHPNITNVISASNFENHYRPVVGVIWWLGFKLWGINPLGYQLVLDATFLGSMIFLYKLGELFHGKIAGVFSFFSFIVCFGYLLSILFWLSDLIKTSCLFFMSIGLFFLLKYIKENQQNKKNLFIGIIFSLLAMFTRETAIIIIPLVVGFYYASQNENRLKNLLNYKSLAILGTILGVTFVSIFMFDPLKTQILNMINSSFSISFIGERLFYYFKNIFSGLSGPILIFMASSIIVIKLFKRLTFKRILFLLCFVFLITFLGYLNSFVGIIFLIVLLLSGFYFANNSQKVFLLWFWGGIIPLLFFDFITTTYITEATFGLSIYIGITVAIILKQLKKCYILDREEILKHYKHSKIISILIVFLIISGVLCGCFIMFPKVNGVYGEINDYKDYQSDFKDSIQFINKNIPQNASIYYFPSNAYDNFFANRYILVNDNLKKILYIYGRPDIKVKSINDFHMDLNHENEYILAQNNYENSIVKEKNIPVQILNTNENNEKITIYSIV